MAGILDIEYVLPEKMVTNEQLATLFKQWTAEKIYDNTGIHTRHVVENETALDLAVRAVEKLFRNHTVGRKDIDIVIYVTQSPDYIMPTSACVLQDRVQLNKSTGSFDVNLGCSGYVYGLAVAKSFVDSGMADYVLLVTADTYSRYIHPFDKSTRMIFGDAATATLIGRHGWQIGEFDFGSDGSGKDLFIIPAGGLKTPCSEETRKEQEEDGNIRTAENIYMEGPGIFDFTIREVPESIKRVLEREKLTKQDVDLYVLHQANRFMLDFLKKIMRINSDNFYINFSDIGNTASSSVPIALKRAMEEGILQRAETILLSGFGGGLSWATTVLRKENNDEY